MPWYHTYPHRAAIGSKTKSHPVVPSTHFSHALFLLLSFLAAKTGWGVTLPWLSYVEGASDVRDGTDIEMQLTFASEMRVVLAKYSLDGKWLGLEEMSTQVLVYIYIP